jgi:hypothetical protein
MGFLFFFTIFGFVGRFLDLRKWANSFAAPAGTPAATLPELACFLMDRKTHGETLPISVN